MSRPPYLVRIAGRSRVRRARMVLDVVLAIALGWLIGSAVYYFWLSP